MKTLTQTRNKRSHKPCRINFSFYTIAQKVRVAQLDNNLHPIVDSTKNLHYFLFDNSSNNVPIQLSPNRTVSISGILDVGTNGKRAWNNVHTTVLISNGRTIAISLADKEIQSHFMGQQIYGIVKKLNLEQTNFLLPHEK